jgi:hypothetical protein
MRRTKMTDKINFCGTECEVLERYEISEEYAKEYDLFYRKRIKFITPDGAVIDCADTF